MPPTELAIAMGISLRRLQELFHESGQHNSDYIWHRRLEVAARRLADPAYARFQIGFMAHRTGIATQDDFSRRFKDRYGLRPREYRHRALS